MRAMGLTTRRSQADDRRGEPEGRDHPCNMTHGAVDAPRGIARPAARRASSHRLGSDGIRMNHEGMKFSLVSRELIADSIEAGGAGPRL
jgi:dihydroxy-acid dehydratase